MRRFSIVTISFNQGEFLERTLSSVLQQEGVEVEYIVLDAGSTDASREIIERYRDRIAHIVFEQDEGPADGLNKGFALATGDIYGYLNSDDVFEPGALAKVAAFFERNPDVDVVCGHGWIIDPHDRRLRRMWSEPVGRWMFAYGLAVQMQPSTFIRREAFAKVGGFNKSNRSNWDSELTLDLYLSGAKFAILDEMLSGFRLHNISYTNSGSVEQLTAAWAQDRFRRLLGRSRSAWDKPVGSLLRLYKHLSQPRATLERIRRGPIFRRGVR